jgi:hypothetical protein
VASIGEALKRPCSAVVDEAGHGRDGPAIVATEGVAISTTGGGGGEGVPLAAEPVVREPIGDVAHQVRPDLQAVLHILGVTHEIHPVQGTKELGHLAKQPLADPAGITKEAAHRLEAREAAARVGRAAG